MTATGDSVVWRGLLGAWDAWLLTLVIAILYPAWGYLRFRRIARMPDPPPAQAKLRLYASIIVSQWLLVIATAAIATRHGITLEDLGQTLADPTNTFLVTVMLLFGFGIVAFLSLRQLGRARYDEMPPHLRRARKVLPGSATELAVFVFVAITAGICEEFLYRGWLVNFYGAASGSTWAGVLLAGINFGAAHAYQGRGGMLLTGVLGIFFGSVFAAAQSLVPVQALHAVIDLVNGGVAGRVLARRISEVRAFEGVEQEGSDAIAEPSAASKEGVSGELRADSSGAQELDAGQPGGVDAPRDASR